MKKHLTRVASIALALALLLSAFFAVPVGASGSGYWWEGIPEGIKDIIRAFDVVGYTSFLDSGGSLGLLGNSKPYYTNSSVETIDWDATSGGGWSGVRGSTASAYQSGQTAHTSIISNSGNKYYLNMPTTNYNNTTNNYYNQYDIDNIYYNSVYNTYNIQTTNNYNYYITYSPTYINITYLDGAKNEVTSNFYFYQLPDGRNSFDLKSEDVFGMYFIYDGVNYKTVIEDEATLALYHFDGNLKDESAYSGSASYGMGASHNYVEHNNFNAALYWGDSEHQLNFNGISGVGTHEFMFYISQPGSYEHWQDFEPFSSKNVYGYYDLGVYDGVQSEASLYAQFARGIFVDYIDTGNELYYLAWSTPGNGTYYYAWDLTLYVRVGFLLNVNGEGYFPVYAKNDYIVHQSRNQATSAVQLAVLESSQLVIAYEQNGVLRELSVGTWHRLAVSGGQHYIDGLRVDALSGDSDKPGTALYMPKYGNYTMLDEFRVTNTPLYSESYTPHSQPFDTNKVMVLPDECTNGQIAVKSNVPVADMRVGGARPTYPAVGDVFVHVEKDDGKHVAQTVQQYQSGGWVTVDAVIGVNGEWQNIKKYDLRSYTVEPGDGSNPNPGGGDGDGSSSTPTDPGDGDGDDEESFWQWLLRVIGDFFGDILGGLLNLVKMLVEGVVTLITSLFDALWSLLDFVTGFGDFLTAAFAFIPPEIISLIVLGLTLAIVLMIVKFLRG